MTHHGGGHWMVSDTVIYLPGKKKKKQQMRAKIYDADNEFCTSLLLARSEGLALCVITQRV